MSELVLMTKILQRSFSNLTKSALTLFLKRDSPGRHKIGLNCKKMLELLQPGDIIFVTDLTRITRSTRDLFELVDTIKQKKTNLKSLKDKLY